jgi:hypothetical protein
VVFSSRMPDYFTPADLFPSHRQRTSSVRRRASMAEGYLLSNDESNGNESPKKRARTGSLSDHG